MRLPRLVPVLSITLALAACADSIPGPGTMTVTLEGPFVTEGAALISIFGAGITGVTQHDGPLRTAGGGKELGTPFINVLGRAASSRCNPATPTSVRRSTAHPISSAVTAASSATRWSLVPAVARTSPVSSSADSVRSALRPA